MQTKSYPLSDNQKGIYYEWEKDKSLTQYNIACHYEFSEAADSGKIKAAFEKVFQAHPVMKVKLRMSGDEVVQYYNEDEPVVISLNKVKESEINEIISGFIRPFDLMESPLYRIEFFQTEKRLHVLMDIHHLIFDGTSFGIFNRDISRAYEGIELAGESFTVCDYAELENNRKGDAEYLEAEAYFDKKLDGITMTRIQPVTTKKTKAGYRQLASDFIGQGEVNDFCTKHKISPNNLFAGALGICLNRYTREQDVAFCTAYHGRRDERLVNSIGMFVSTLPVVMRMPAAQKVPDFLAGIRTGLTELWSKQNFSFSEMVKKYRVSMEVMYSFQKGLNEDFEMDNSHVSCRLLRTATTNESLTAYIYQAQHDYEIRCEYNDSLYDQQYIKTFATAIKNVVIHLMADENKACSDIMLLSPEQEAEVIKVSIGKSLFHDRSLSLVDIFTEQAMKSPENIAVVYGSKKLTYCELDEVTDKIAKKLRLLGVEREKVVGVMIERSEYMVIYPLAVLKAGGAYMPLDFSMPSDRLSFMVKDAGAKHILSEGSRVADFIPDFEGIVINREEIEVQETGDEIVLPKPSPEDMFVLLYTSGSTGTPKGCMLEHRNVVSFCKWYAEEMDVTPDDRCVAYANFAFDAHMIDIYPMITSGASVYIIPSEIRLDIMRLNQYMEENGLTIALLTTQIGKQFAEDIDNHSLRLLCVGGERLTPTKKPLYRFYNLYGPTEITICSTFYNIESDYNSAIIGKSTGNVSNYILDQNLQLLPIGVAGELCIGGEGVSRGYLNRDDLTREKFITWKGQRLYRSGDNARYTETGEIEYISRLDNQVKLRGLRIELGEIENAMSGFGGISSAVVDVKEIRGVQHLCGYFTAKTQIDTEALKDFLRTSLTEFMVPAAMIQLEKLPLTNNGKVNRKALPLPEIGSTFDYVAPTNEVEEGICGVYSNILKIDKVGTHDNFFEIGGSSMSAIKAIIQIINLGYSIKYGDLFKLKTPLAVAKFLTDHKEEAETAEEVQLEDISDYDYSAINRVLEKNKPDLWENFTGYNLGDVLLTGATGYLGIHVLKELIDKETGRIYCMVRSKGSLTPSQRLKTQLMYYFSDTFDETIGTRIIPVDGDITNMATLKSLEGMKISTVINCAASVKHFDASSEIEKINVDGVVNLIGFCKGENARLIHISTMSTFGLIEKDKLSKETVMNESRLYMGQKIDNKYVLTKFKAERHVLQSVSEGLDAKIMRVGNLMGRHSDGEFQINFRSNAFVNVLKSYKVLGMFPLSQLISPLEISPIDCTARAVVSLSRAPHEIVVLHVYNNYRLNMANVIFAMQQYGFEVTLVSDKVFDERFEEFMKDSIKSEYLSGLLQYQPGGNLVEVPDENNFTTTLLYKNGIRWPLASDDYSIKLIGLLDGLGFFDED